MHTNETDVFFWTRDGKYGPLSNFWRQPIVVDEITWPTTEHFYQAMKTQDPKEREMVRRCSTPKEAKFAGYHVKLRQDWEEVKENYMLQALRAKFFPNPYLRKLLLETGIKPIHEASPWDKYWGYVYGEGKDRLGILLMQIRKELQEEEKNAIS